MNNWHLKQAARVIHAGGIIAYPTEAVYGLGCDPFNHTAVMHLLALKQRPVDKGLILIAANIGQLTPFILPLDETALQTLNATWPDPVTWLLPARPEIPVWLRGHHNTIAVRLTKHPLAAALCQATGHALVSTSANLSGRQPAKTSLRVRQQFGDQLDYLLTAPTGGQSQPSTIRDLQTGKTLRKS